MGDFGLVEAVLIVASEGPNTTLCSPQEEKALAATHLNDLLLEPNSNICVDLSPLYRLFF